MGECTGTGTGADPSLGGGRGARSVDSSPGPRRRSSVATPQVPSGGPSPSVSPYPSLPSLRRGLPTPTSFLYPHPRALKTSPVPFPGSPLRGCPLRVQQHVLFPLGQPPYQVLIVGDVLRPVFASSDKVFVPVFVGPPSDLLRCASLSLSSGLKGRRGWVGGGTVHVPGSSLRGWRGVRRQEHGGRVVRRESTGRDRGGGVDGGALTGGQDQRLRCRRESSGR